MPQRWFEISLPIPGHLTDEAAALLDLAGFSGVEIRDRGETTSVVVVVETTGEAGDEAIVARESVAILGAGDPVITELDPKVWTENWKAHFARRTFADRIEVRPPWEAAPADGGLLSIVINPGMAFGTGLHETTAGCLELLVAEIRPGMSVADVGCGSGILAIAAARLGATSVLATDVDPLAVEATSENIAANAVAGVVHVELEPGEVGVPEWENDARPGLAASRVADAAGERSVDPTAADRRNAHDERAADKTAGSVHFATPNGATTGGFAARGKGAFDLLVANILAGTLIEMRDALTSSVRPGGTLVLSGIEAGRLKTVEEAFIRFGWHLAQKVSKGDWVSLSLHHGLAEHERSLAEHERSLAELEQTPSVSAPGAAGRNDR